MAIEFHCPLCNLLIKAPDEAGGKKGRCPHCKGVCYIPMPPDQVGEYDLAPLDPDEERRRQAALAETARTQQALLHDRGAPDDRLARGAAGRAASPHGGASAGRGDASRGSGAAGALTPQERIVAYVEAMSAGRLDDAERQAGLLAPHKAEVARLIERIAADDLATAGMPDVPRPVLLGFLRQLQGRL